MSLQAEIQELPVSAGRHLVSGTEWRHTLLALVPLNCLTPKMWGSFRNFASSYRRTRDIGGVDATPLGHSRLSKSLGHSRVKMQYNFG
jgi:hypothetical protein